MLDVPIADWQGVHDIAVFDIDGDGWKDMVVGRCDTTEVYINVPPAPGLRFLYPQGLPSFIPPGQPFTLQVQVEGFDGAFPQPGTGSMFASVNGGPFNEVGMTPLGGDLYEATLPAAGGCAQEVAFYFLAEERNSGEIFRDPADAPTGTHKAIASFGTEILVEESSGNKVITEVEFETEEDD